MAPMRVHILPATSLAIPPPPRPPPWRQALHNLAFMLRNVAFCGVAAMATAFLTSRGNIFSSVSPAQQSRTTFMVANLLTTQLIGALVTFLIVSARLMSHRFLTRPHTKPSFVFCVLRVGKGALPLYIGAAFTVLAMGLACAALPVSYDQFKLEYYLEAIIGQVFATACEAHLRRVVKTETIEGLQPSKPTRSLRRLSSKLYSDVRKAAIVRWIKSFLHSLPSLVSFLIAGGYIHATNHIRLTKGLETNLFVGGSLALKLAMQELAKHYLLKKNVTSLKRMCIVVSVPTVLIDTQARLAILGLQDAKSTLMNSYIMATVELAVRFLRIAWLRLLVRRKERETDAITAALRAPRAHARQSNGWRKANKAGPQDPLADLLTWRQQQFRFHTAESHADMYAEYIAIVCSAAIAAFWSTSPQYTIDSIPANQTAAGLVSILLIQLVIELAVDCIASTFEISNGVELAHTRGLGVFLGMLFGMLTVVNINMSAILYVRSRETK